MKLFFDFDIWGHLKYSPLDLTMLNLEAFMRLYHSLNFVLVHKYFNLQGIGGSHPLQFESLSQFIK